MKEFLLSLMLVGCGPHPNVLQVAPEAQPFVADFETTSGYPDFKIKDLILKLSPDEAFSGTEIGVCRIPYNGDTRVIELRATFWKYSSDMDKRELVFHELGHCILGRRHDDTIDSRGRPVSLMHSTHLGSLYNDNTKKSYDDELFSLSGKYK